MRVMKNSCLEHYKPVETALKEAGLKIEEIVKHRKKIVITVTRCVKRKTLADRLKVK